MIAALYARVSTEEQARHGYSLAAQLEACRERATACGAREQHEFVDEGVSGALLSRPALTALREALRRQGVDLVVVYDPDRLARNLAHQLLLTEEIEQAGARLEFVNFEWRNTPEGQLFYALRGAVAQFEKEKIRERTSRGRVQKARSGKLPLAFRPYGYDYDAPAAALRVNPAEAAVVREVFRLLLTAGMGPNAIARQLNDRGVPTRKGGPWHRVVVRQILQHECYTGTFYTNRYDCTGVGLNRHRPKAERRRCTLRARAEWVPVQVPAIISRAEWEQAQALLGQARRLWTGQPRSEYLLTGLLVCGACRQSMCGARRRRGGGAVRTYTCRKAWAGARATGCPARYVAAAPLEAAVWTRVQALLAADPHLALPAADEAAGAALATELAVVRQALARSEQGRAAVLAVLESGALDAALGAAALQRIQDRQQALATRRDALTAALAHTGGPETVAGERLAAARAFLGELEAELTLAERRSLLRPLVERVVVHQQGITLALYWPEASLVSDGAGGKREGNPDAPAQPEAGAGGGLTLRPDRGGPRGQRDHAS